MGERCPGCGVMLPRSDGPTHAYVVTSPSCWGLFSQSLIQNGYRLFTDAYMAQHPGGTDRRQVQSVAVHLVTLFAVLEKGRSESEASKITQEAVVHGRDIGGYPKLPEPDPTAWPHNIEDVDARRASHQQYATSVLRVWEESQGERIAEWTLAVLGRI